MRTGGAMTVFRQAVRQVAFDRLAGYFPDTEKRDIERSQLYRCLIEIGDDAVRSWTDGDEMDAAWRLAEAFDPILDLAESAGRDGPKLNFWQHTRVNLDQVKRGDAPDFNRFTLSGAVDGYLSQSARSASVDRTVVDMLVACEVYAFLDEAYGRKLGPSRIVRGNGPVGCFLWRLASLVLFGLPVLAILALRRFGWISGEWPFWIAGILAGLFVLESAWALIVFPFAWRRQIKNNARMGELAEAMNGVYCELEGSGPISARHIWERAQAASQSGVVWPSGLFAVLDDLTTRTGRF